MTITPYPSALLNDLLSDVYRPVTALPALHQAIQGAITLAFATVPAALTSLYTVSSTDKKTAELFVELVQSKLHHACQLANLLVAVGGVPKFCGAHTPRYPCRILGSDTALQPLLDLDSAPDTLLASLNASSETRSVMELPGERQPITSIGQLYKLIEDSLVVLEENAQLQGESIFETSRGYRQLDEELTVILGSPLDRVSNLMDAHLLLRELVGQRSVDGADDIDLPEHICAVSPAVYGQVVKGCEKVDPAWIKKLSDLFDNYYSLWLRSQERCFEEPPEGSRYHVAVVVELMGEVFPRLAMALRLLSAETLPAWLYRPNSLEQTCLSNQLLLASLRADQSSDWSMQIGVLTEVTERSDRLLAMA